MEWTEQQIADAQAELESWRGLPHMDRRAEPGKGIDCIHLAFQAVYGAGILEPRKLPPYRTRWGLVSPENLMAEGLTRIMHATRHKRARAQYGDFVIWTAGKTSNHCGIVAFDQDDPVAVAELEHLKEENIRLAGHDARHEIRESFFRKRREIEAARRLVCWHVLKGGVVHTTPLKPVIQRAQELVRIDQPGWRLDPPGQLKLKDLET